MIYLNTASSAQTFTFIPSKFVISANIKVTDEETGLHQTKLVGISKLNNLGSISVALNLKEGKFYRLQITSLHSRSELESCRYKLGRGLNTSWCFMVHCSRRMGSYIR